MKKKLPLILLLFISTIVLGQDLNFTFVNAHNTNVGMLDYYEADIYISSTVDFKLGTGQLYFNYNTAAFGDNVDANNGIEFTAPDGEGYICGQGVDVASAAKIYSGFIVNDNTDLIVSVAFTQTFSSSTFAANNVTSIPTKLFHIKIKYTDVNEDPMVNFDVSKNDATDTFFTACGSAGGGPFDAEDCVNVPGVQIFGLAVDSTGASRINEIVWDGDLSSSWATDGNWDSGATPVITDDIIVPNVATTPSITTAVQINDLTVEASSSFAISEDGSVTVDGDFINNGTFNITSTASTSGALLANGTVTGNVTYERGGLLSNKWSLVSAPVSGQSIKEFADNTANDIRKNTSTTPNRYAIGYYDDSKVAGSKWVYYDVDYLAANPSETFEKGRSYAMSRGTDGNVSFTGTVKITDATKTVTASEWNAIGNPYTAFLPINENAGTNFINDNLAKFDPTNVGIYVWDNAQDKYVGKSLVSSEASLSPGQGFFVKTTAAVSTLTFSESERKAQPATGGTFARGGKLLSSIQFLATSEDVTVDTNIKYFETATAGLDPGYDLGNYARASFDVYTRLVSDESGKDFTIQSISTTDVEKTIIPIGIKSEAGITIIFSVKALNLPEGVEVFIEDKEQKTFTKLNESKGYTVTISEKTNGVGRFYLQTRNSKLPENVLHIDEVEIYKIDTNLIINGLATGEFNVKLYNILGASVFETTVESNGNNTVSLPSLQTGIYIVRVNSELGVKSKKIMIK